jgi:hypothetical protein
MPGSSEPRPPTRTMFERIRGIEPLFNVPYLSLDLLPLVESK